MRAIKETIYKNMTAKQRVTATIEALARGDEDEKTRLNQTCPKYSYTMIDHRYYDKIMALQTLALAVENDMRGCIMAFFCDGVFYNRNYGNSTKSLMINIELYSEHVEDMLGIRKAWRDFLAEECIDPDMAETAFGEMRNHVTKAFIQIGKKLELEPDDYAVQKFKQCFRNYYDGI